MFMAEQTQPVRRKVALKVVKPGMDSRQIIARFEAERQALAMMDHVNIARVLDAGATESGRPYFVMELVHGVPITKYCDDNHLTPRERLELFVPVCQAIQHAHQKGIIHRDIKPSNVMITLYDGQPVPKVIDFGVAKATEQRLTERTMFTQYGAMVGTLEYMSPEQAEMSALGVDTRSDIYSLGVLLYELLTGSTPLSQKRLKEVAYGELLRLIKEEEPPLPSTRLRDSGEALASISAQRHMEPAKLTKVVSGELDWIVMKTLEKDRNRRYETVNSFAADVQRYLNDEPVQACPPSALYRFRKFARRNRAAMVTVALVSAALVLGIVLSRWQAFRADRERDNAVRAEKLADQRLVDVEQANVQTIQALTLLREANAKTETALGETMRAQSATAQALAQSEELREQAEAVANYLVEVFRSPDPLQDSREIKVLQLLDRAAEWLNKEFVGDPATKGKLLNALAQTYLGLGLPAQALPLHEQARTVRSDALGPDHPDTLSSMNNLALAYSATGRRAEAIPLLEQTLELRKAKLGPEHFDTLSSMNNLAEIYYAEGTMNKAVPLFEQAFQILRVKFSDHPDTFNSLNARLRIAYQTTGQQPKYLQLVEETIKLWDGKVSANKLHALQTIKQQLEEPLGVEPTVSAGLVLQENLLQDFKTRFGSDHPVTLATMSTLGNAYQVVGRLQDALRLFEESLNLRKSKLGADHPDTLASMVSLADAYWEANRRQEALSLYEEKLRLCKATFGPDHSKTLTSLSMLADAYMHVGYEGLNPEQAPLPAADKIRSPEAIQRLIDLFEAWGKSNEAAEWRKKLAATKSDAQESNR